MIFQLSSHHITIGDELREFTEAKLSSCLAPMVEDPATTVEVMLGHDQKAAPNERWSCRVNVLVPREGHVVVSRTSDKVHTAIQLVHDTLMQQTRQMLERHHDMHRTRKEAEKSRVKTARQSMTTYDDAEESAPHAKWEAETRAFETSKDSRSQLL